MSFAARRGAAMPATVRIVFGLAPFHLAAEPAGLADAPDGRLV